MTRRDPPRTKRNYAAAAGCWSATHRRKAIVGWLAFVLAAFVIGGAIGQRHLTQAEMGNGQSGRALRAYSEAFPKQASEQVLVQGTGRVSIGSPAFTAAVQDLVARLDATRYVSDVRSPLSQANRAQLAHDGRSALVTFQLAGDESQVQQRVDGPLAATAAVQRAHPSLRIEEFGDASAGKALNQSFSSDFHKAEYTSLPITLIILLFAFGALVAAGVPLLLGLTAVMAALGLLGPFSHLIPVAQGTIDSIVLLIGLAVGVDYSMFYLRRKLEERRAGR
ncbi:MAG TPA: MMPL family transporter, partial [Solirubrobacteraceae bacterium]|nr:MMPL family transporter [Solirubrobacteraceae bacterium]